MKSLLTIGILLCGTVVALAQSLPETAAFIILGGSIDPSEFKVTGKNHDVVVQDKETVLNWMQSKWYVSDKEKCIVERLHEGKPEERGITPAGRGLSNLKPT